MEFHKSTSEKVKIAFGVNFHIVTWRLLRLK